jgi:hypothetical protein
MDGELRELGEIFNELFLRCLRSARCTKYKKRSEEVAKVNELRSRYNSIISRLGGD